MMSSKLDVTNRSFCFLVNEHRTRRKDRYLA